MIINILNVALLLFLLKIQHVGSQEVTCFSFPIIEPCSPIFMPQIKISPDLTFLTNSSLGNSGLYYLYDTFLPCSMSTNKHFILPNRRFGLQDWDMLGLVWVKRLIFAALKIWKNDEKTCFCVDFYRFDALCSGSEAL